MRLSDQVCISKNVPLCGFLFLRFSPAYLEVTHFRESTTKVLFSSQNITGGYKISVCLITGDINLDPW